MAFPSSDIEPMRDFPLQGNSASLSLGTGIEYSNVQIITPAVRERSNAPDPWVACREVLIDAAIGIKVDAPILGFIYAAILNNQIRYGDTNFDRIDFDIECSFEQLKTASTGDKVGEFKIERWFLEKYDED